MCKKSCLLISLVLVLGLFNVQFGYCDTVWWSDMDPNNHSWSSNENWVHWDEDIQDVVVGNVPNSSDVVYIGKGVLEAYWPPILNDLDDVNRRPVIEPNAVASCYALWGPVGFDSETGWFWWFDIEGGSLTIGNPEAPEAWMVWVVGGTDGDGEVTMTGGEVNVGADMILGDWGGVARLNMSDGEINVNWALCMPGVGSSGGENCEASGTLSLSGGTIRCGGLYLNEWAAIPPTWDGVSEWMSIATREPIVGRPSYTLLSTIDFSGGKIIIDGDYVEIIANYVNQEYISVYGLGENEIAPDGDRTYIGIHYDAEADTTTVMGSTADPNCAYNPDPVHYAKDLPVNTVLDWSEGDNTIAHDIYIGTSFDDVSNADTSDLSGIYKGGQSNDPNTGGGSIYIPLELWEMNTTYYWRVDEFDGINLWPGRLWCFKIGDYYSVDDFDSYADNAALKAVWNDSQVNDSGAVISIQDDEDFAPDGTELDYYYDNRLQVDGIYVGSVVDVNTPHLGISPDWTTDGLTTSLVLYFYGDPMNSATVNDQMYAAIKDTGGTIGAVLYDGELSDILEQEWHEWNIDLQKFIDEGVDVTSIAKFYIGFGGPHTGQIAKGGTGTVYFNDVRLYATRCVPEKVIADLTGDCVVDLADFEVMANDWLACDYDIVAEPPSMEGLVAWYQFEGNFDDSSGNEIHGVPNGDAAIISDPGGNGKNPSRVLTLDGYEDYVNCGSDPNLDITGSITLACWIKIEEFGPQWQAIVTRGDNSYRIARNGMMRWLEFCLNYLSVPYIKGATKVDDGQWHHVIGLYEHNVAMYLYVDGVIDAFSPTGGDINISEHDLCIGCNFGGSLREWEGEIDDVRIYNRAITDEEILYLYTEGQGEPVYAPLMSPANLYDEEPQYEKSVNLLDFAIMVERWLEEILWPWQ
jgi:hypothetical protein